MELLKEIFDLKLTKDFIFICESVAQKNPQFINNGIGVNYSEKGIESIKFYYGFHHKLSKGDVELLHLFGTSDTFFELEEQLIESDYVWHDYLPTGVSFALKIDKNFKSSIGHFMMPKIQSDDLFFSLPKVKAYYEKNSGLPIFNRKGIFTLINEKAEEHHKDYFYVTNPVLKEKIGQEFKVDLNIVPSIEWVLGKGYYDNSSVNDEKIVLQSNYGAVYEAITKKETWKIVKDFNKIMLEHFNTYCVCPGFYKNKNIKSYYYFNASLPSPTIVNTIKNIQTNLHLI